MSDDSDTATDRAVADPTGSTGSTDEPTDGDPDERSVAADGGLTVTAPIRSFRTDPRRGLELVALAAIGALVAVFVGFVLAYWLREYPFAAFAYEQYVIAGRRLDLALGTNVFRHPFMWQIFATGVMIGVAAPLVGTFLVHRQMALIGETLAHTAFAGVAVGFLAGSATGWSGSPLFAALVVSILGALGVQWLAERTDAYGDVPIAIMLSGSFAVGTILVSLGRGQQGISIEDFLFGSLSVVSVEGARLMVALGVLVVVVIALTYKQLLFITFDEQAARVARIPVDRYNALLVVLTAVVVVGAMQVLGIILVAGMLVIPVATASQVARGFREALRLSVVFGQIAILGGLAMSIAWGLPSGGSVIVVAISLYLLTVALSGRTVAALTTH